MSYRVYFGRLPDSLSQDEFEKMLSEHGKARNIEWKSGYAYVDYKHGSDASKTVQNLNGKEVGGSNILVELARNGAGGFAVAGAFPSRPFAKPPQSRPIRTPHRVRIENLSSRTRWMELKELLSLAGEVTFADTHKRKTGEGIVEFATRRDMDEAIKTFHNTSFYGKTIKLYDESPRGRSRSPSGQRSRSHSQQRSSERKRRSRSKSPRRRKSSSSRHASPRRHPKRRSRSGSKDRSSKKRDSRSRTPKRNSHKKSKKSKRDSSRSRSKSPRDKKHKCSRSNSHSSSDNNNDSKRKSKTNKKKKHLSDLSASDSSDSSK